MTDIHTLSDRIKTRFENELESVSIDRGELTIEVLQEHLLQVALHLRDDVDLAFDMLVDIAGVDYLSYGSDDWTTFESTSTGFSRGVEAPSERSPSTWKKPRFAVVYHLLSVRLNHRIRMRVFTEGEPPMVDSVFEIWNSANWYEREAFDLYGILFRGHPDLRRILTDYGFIGHPFRKDFPLIGEVEMRYDAREQRVVYEKVSIKPRTLVPKVIRDDHRYIEQALQDTE